MAENLNSDVELIPESVSIAYNALEIVEQYFKHKEIFFSEFFKLPQKWPKIAYFGRKYTIVRLK